MVIGAILPWQRYVYPSVSASGCFGCGGGTYGFSGSQLGNGRVALFAGLAMALTGLLMTAYPAAREWFAITLAPAVVVAAAAVGGWWLKQMPGAVVAVGIIEICGVTLGLAAVPLCLPGPIRKRAAFLAAVVLLCVVGVVLARPESTGDAVSY